jgi:hypothetical protein
MQPVLWLSGSPRHGLADLSKLFSGPPPDEAMEAVRWDFGLPPRGDAAGSKPVIGGWVLDADALHGFAAGHSVRAEAFGARHGARCTRHGSPPITREPRRTATG